MSKKSRIHFAVLLFDRGILPVDSWRWRFTQLPYQERQLDLRVATILVSNTSACLFPQSVLSTLS